EQLLRNGSSFLGDEQADHIEYCELRGEGLGTGNTDLRAGVRIGTCMRSSRGRGAYYVTYASDNGAALLCKFYRGECVCCFSRLGYCNYHIALAYDGIAVPEFRGVLNFH